MQPRIVFIGGMVDDRVIPLARPEVSFGRDPTNTVHLNDDLVSRYHCCIRNIHGHFHIYDLQSLNGTFINDVAVPERTLRHGDKIRIGKSELLFLIQENRGHAERILISEQIPRNDLSAATAAQAITIRIFLRLPDPE